MSDKTVAELTPLPLTDPHPFQGEAVMRDFPAGRYPSCSKHGAMNRVTAEKDWWRCLACNIGVEWHRKPTAICPQCGAICDAAGNCVWTHP